jgi:hypothetical protein
MRTTLDVADDVLLAARERAAREKISIGEALSRMAREGLQRTPAAGRRGKSSFGIRPLPRRGGVVTNDLINKLREQDIY